MSATASIASTPNWRADFPALDQSVHKQPLVYLDSAASAQQPAAVIDAVADYQRRDHANVHRGVHELSGRAVAVFVTGELIGTRGPAEHLQIAHWAVELVNPFGQLPRQAAQGIEGVLAIPANHHLLRLAGRAG